MKRNPGTVSATLRWILLPMMLTGSYTANGEDLWDVYQLALESDAIYLAAKESYEAAQLNLPLARTGFKPTVNGKGTLGKQRSNFRGPTTTGDNNEISVNLNLPLLNRTTRIQISQAELEVQRALLQFDNARDDLTLRVAERYFNLLAARDAKEVARLQKIAIKRQMDLAEERLEVGLGTRTDLFDARARFQQADADLIASDIEISNARQALIEIINVTPQTISELAEDSPLDPPEPDDIDHWVNLARTNNLQVKSEELNLLLAGHEVDRQRARRSPTVAFEASQRWADNGSGAGGGSTNSTSLGVTLNLPLYLGGSVDLRTRQAGLRQNEAEQVLEASRRSATSSTTTAFLAITNGISQVIALAEAIVAGESALKAKEEGFSAGLTTNLDVLDAQRDLSLSRTNYLRARYNYILSLLRLEKATGDLGDEDIRFINGWLTDRNTAYRYEEILEHFPLIVPHG